MTKRIDCDALAYQVPSAVGADGYVSRWDVVSLDVSEEQDKALVVLRNDFRGGPQVAINVTSEEGYRIEMEGFVWMGVTPTIYFKERDADRVSESEIADLIGWTPVFAKHSMIKSAEAGEAPPERALPTEPTSVDNSARTLLDEAVQVARQFADSASSANRIKGAELLLTIATQRVALGLQ